MDINDIVVHKTEGIVRVNEVVYMKKDGIDIPYYVFMPYFKVVNGNKIMLPENMIEGRIRKPIDDEQATKIINSIKNFNLCVWNDDNKTRRLQYDEALLSANPHELSKLVYLIKRKIIELRGTKKTISKYDGDILNRAMRVLYGELAYALSVSIEEIDLYFNKALENA